MSSRKHILTRIKPIALGNTNRDLLDVCSDLLNQDKGNWQVVAEKAFLSFATVVRVALCERPYSPRADTLERIIRYYGVKVSFAEEHIESRYDNKPKAKRKPKG